MAGASTQEINRQAARASMRMRRINPPARAKSTDRVNRSPSTGQIDRRGHAFRHCARSSDRISI
jgi:hypothetical protein